MAPNLAGTQQELAKAIIESEDCSDSEIANTIGCSPRSIQTMRANLQCFGTTKAPRNAVGRPSSITPPMLNALYDLLRDKPYLYQDKIAAYIAKKFDIRVGKINVSRAFASIG